MDVQIEPDYKRMSAAAAALILNLVRKEPDAVLVLPAGETPLGTYRQLVEAQAAGSADLSGVTIFALDEWGGRGREHTLSCHRTLATALVEKVGVPPERFHSLDGAAPDPDAECRRYAKLFRALGPPALSLVGLGTNGHVGFNEPASRLPATVRRVALAPPTVERAKRELGDEAVVPYGLTLSLAQIMSAREVVLIASGSHKATALGNTFAGHVTTVCPGSLLQLHPAATAIVDEAAAQTLS